MSAATSGGCATRDPACRMRSCGLLANCEDWCGLFAARAGTCSETIHLTNAAHGLSAPVCGNLEEGPMRRLALTMLAMGIILTAGPARAQRFDPAYPVCLQVVTRGASPYYRCSYVTMDQCRASANGQMCSLNPFYAGATASVRRSNRRHDRQLGSRSPAPAEVGSYAPLRPTRHFSAPYTYQSEPYYGASQGYAPGEKERFLESVRRYM